MTKRRGELPDDDRELKPRRARDPNNQTNGRWCTAHPTKRYPGGTCGNYAIKGGTRCYQRHGGKAPQVFEAARRQVAQANAMDLARRMLEEVGQDKDPIVHLLECLYLAAGLVKVWGQMVADLDHAGEVALSGDDADLVGKQRGWAIRVVKNLGTETKPKWTSETNHDPLLVQTKDGVKVHPFVDEYKHWVREKARYAKLCLDAGIQKRMVDLATAQASVWVQAFVAVIDNPALELTATQRMDARRFLSAKLKELEAA